MKGRTDDVASGWERMGKGKRLFSIGESIERKERIRSACRESEGDEGKGRGAVIDLKGMRKEVKRKGCGVLQEGKGISAVGEHHRKGRE